MPPVAEIEVRGPVVVARPAGDVDVASADGLHELLLVSVPNGAETLVLDLTRARYVDSAGIRVLFALARQLRNRQQEMRLVVPDNEPMRKVLSIVGLDAAVAIDKTVDEALAAAANRSSPSAGGGAGPAR